MTDLNVELARQDGQEYRSVRLSVSGTRVHLHAHDMGPAVEQSWGREGEYEFWVDVGPQAYSALIFALLKERFAGDVNAVNAFRELCQRNAIPHEFMNWA